MKQSVLYGSGGGGWFQTIAVKAPSGASISVSGGGETLTATGTGTTYYAIDVHNQSTQYTVSVTMPSSVGGANAIQTVTTGTTDGVISFVDAKFATITTSVTDAFEGVAVTCVSGGTTLTITPSVGTTSITFRVPSTGNWVISGEVGQQTYYASPNPVVISDLDDSTTAALETRPDGKTVTPTDDISKWLLCGGVNKSYTTLSEVLADKDTLAILITDHNAVDYMVRSTTWASSICADERAMRYIGLRNYCADTLIADSTWMTAIWGSTYRSSVLNATVPTLSSGANCFSSGREGNYYEYLAFDGNNSTFAAVTAGVGGYIGYTFPDAVKIKGYSVYDQQNKRLTSFKVQGSNIGANTDINDISGVITMPSNFYASGMLSTEASNTAYKYIRIYQNSVSNSIITYSSIQFYGRADVDESKMLIYSAASDNDIYYLDNGTPVNVGSTNSSCVGEVSRTDLPNGTYTLYSSVAKNPTSLSSDYSKEVTIDSNTIEIYLMPDNTLYWWGYKSDELETCSAANGWTPEASYSWGNPTYNTNDVYLYSNSSGNVGFGIGTKNKVTGTYNIITEGVTASGGYYGLCAPLSTKNAGTISGDTRRFITSQSLALTPITVSDKYLLTYCWRGAVICKVRAFFAE